MLANIRFIVTITAVLMVKLVNAEDIVYKYKLFRVQINIQVPNACKIGFC